MPAAAEQKALDALHAEDEALKAKKPKTKRVSMAPKPAVAATKPLRGILKNAHPPTDPDQQDGNDGEYEPDAEAEGGVEGFESEEDDNATVAIQDLAEDPSVVAFDEQLTTSIKSKKGAKAAAAAVEAPKRSKKAAVPVQVQGEPSTGKSSKPKSKSKAKPKAAAAAAAAAEDDDEYCDIDAILANPRNSRVCNIVSSDIGQPVTMRNACKHANGCLYTLFQSHDYEPCEHSNEDLSTSNESKYARIRRENFLHFELQGKPPKSSVPRVLSFFIDNESQLVTCSRPMLMKLFYNDFGRDYALMRKRYLDWARNENVDKDGDPYRVPPVFFTAKDLNNKTGGTAPALACV